MRSAPPSMLDLIRLSPRKIFPPGGVNLYRQLALLADMDERCEVLDVACGTGVVLEYFVNEFGVEGSGVDADPALVDQAEARSRESGSADRLQYQVAPPDALPYRDAIFDVAIGEVGVGREVDPAAAVRELLRVTKPGGFVALLQLVWKAPVDSARQAVLSGHLGVTPRMVVEWKRLMKEAGVEELQTEDWSDLSTSFRDGPAKPFPDFAEMFSLTEKIGIMRRAWGQWGWQGVRAALQRERAVHTLLTRERILGLALLRGRKSQNTHSDGRAEDEPPRTEVSPDPSSQPSRETPDDPLTEATEGLPLFGTSGPQGSSGG